MAITFVKQLDKHYIHCRMDGVGMIAEILAYIDELSADPQLDAPFYEIVDFSGTEKLDFGYYQSNQLLQKYQDLGASKGYLGSIFVTGSDFTRGISNMFQSVGSERGVNISIVKSLDEALALVEARFDADGELD